MGKYPSNTKPGAGRIRYAFKMFRLAILVICVCVLRAQWNSNGRPDSGNNHGGSGHRPDSNDNWNNGDGFNNGGSWNNNGRPDGGRPDSNNDWNGGNGGNGFNDGDSWNGNNQGGFNG